MTVDTARGRQVVLSDDEDRALNEIADRMAVRLGDGRRNRSLAIRRLIAAWDEDTWLKLYTRNITRQDQAA